MLSAPVRRYVSRLNRASQEVVGCTRQMPCFDYVYDSCLEAHFRLCQRDIGLHRAITLLCAAGQDDEAGILLLAQLESCFYSVYIGSDHDKAARWLNHKDPVRPPGPSVRERIGQCLEGKAAASDWYRKLYQELSWIKHANPVGHDDTGTQAYFPSNIYYYVEDSSTLLVFTLRAFVDCCRGRTYSIYNYPPAWRAVEHWEGVVDGWTAFAQEVWKELGISAP